jgi:hypothetical protein
MTNVMHNHPKMRYDKSISKIIFVLFKFQKNNFSTFVPDAKKNVPEFPSKITFERIGNCVDS